MYIAILPIQIQKWLTCKHHLQEDRLWVSDPKALQHILQSAGYDYPKPFDNRLLSSLGTGFGILTVDGKSLYCNVGSEWGSHAELSLSFCKGTTTSVTKK
jgi:hypothetical protein